MIFWISKDYKPSRKWFKIIKTHDGKKFNIIAYGEKIFGSDETLALINGGHKEWKKI
jgi:hypothetical protein